MIRFFSRHAYSSSRNALLFLGAAALFSVPFLSAQASPSRQEAFLQSAAQQPKVLYTFKLPHGESAVVYKSGVAKIYTANFSKVETRMITGLAGRVQGGDEAGTPSKAELRFELSKPVRRHPYANHEVLVVYRNGVRASQDVVNVPSAKLRVMSKIKSLTGAVAPSQAPHYTSSGKLNALLGRLGVDRSARLFRNIPSARLQAMVERANTNAASGHALLNIANAYELHITNASVPQAVAELRRSGAVAYASPAYYVSSMHTSPIALSHGPITGNATADARLAPATGTAGNGNLPSNYGLQSSLQSAFNAPSLNAAAAYDEIVRKFDQLPGTGEIITNVSLGDLDDAGAASNPNDPCNFWVSVYGPTTIVQGGQRYLNLPSMPLIPTYTADANGNLNGDGEVCGVGPLLVEVGLDFSVMSPLPHDQQRPGEIGTGLTDLLGIAPGASYRLIVPASSAPTNADIDAAFLAAALQSPRPNVITASLGFGEDRYGFPSRYLGDDPLTAAVIGAIVNNYHIVVTISSGDGLRTYTNAAVSPSGGAAPTNVSHGNPTDLNDIWLSTMPSRDPDTGAIDVGGTTLDDIFAAPPQDWWVSSELKAQHAFAETRWTGFTNFASGYGDRVNVSAPSDNIIAFEHTQGGAADAVTVVLNGGTSASAPEVAASAAVLLQVARLTGHPFSDLQALRAFLEQTGTPVPKVPQSDVHNHVGPQVNLGRAVETLFAQADNAVSPQVNRVAVEQRRGVANGDAAFQTNTDPKAIDLSGSNLRAWITIAPDWEGVSVRKNGHCRRRGRHCWRRGRHCWKEGQWREHGRRHCRNKVHYRLTVHRGGHRHGRPHILATTPWARLQPKAILEAAGLPLASDAPRTVELTYRATGGGIGKVETTFSLTFGPSSGQSEKILAPAVPPVVTGGTIPVHYDLRNTGISSATLVVLQAGRVTPWTGIAYHIAYSTPVGGGEGTVNVPVSALGEGGGIYGIGIQTGGFSFSDFAFTRVQPEASSARPPAPLLSVEGAAPGHNLVISYGEDATVSWDVSNVPGATGVILEISAAAPNVFNSYRTFNNPNGSQTDNGNVLDTGSLYHLHLPGASGTKTFSGAELTSVLVPTLFENVRVIPVAGGTVVGEASRISTITMTGVFAADGGFIVNGWGINAHGSDGFITSGPAPSVFGVPPITLSGNGHSLEIFDQTTNAITKVVASEPNHLFFTEGWGIYGNDIGLFGNEDESNFMSVYHTLDTVADGTVGSQWTPPDINIIESAANQLNDTALFFGQIPGDGPVTDRFRVFTSDLLTNTNSPLYDVSGPVSSFGFGDYWGIAENPNNHTGLLVGFDFSKLCSAPPTLVIINLDNGEINHVFQGVGASAPAGVAIDSQTNMAAVPNYCDPTVGIYDDSTGTANLVTFPGGGNGMYTAADPVHHLFLVEQTTPPHGSGAFATLNNNAVSAVYVINEKGDVLKRLERFNLYNIFITIPANNLQVNPLTRTGYIYGLGGQQLEPFKY